MDILWNPHVGLCAGCGSLCSVRIYASGGRADAYCFACWSSSQSEQGGQVGYVMSSSDWNEDESLVFRYPGADHGASQRAFLD